MNKHTESIIIFGLVLPGVVLAILLGGVVFARGKLNATAAQKMEAYREYEQTVASLTKVEAEFSGRSQNLAYWKESLDKELIQTLTTSLREAMTEYTDDQLRQTELSRPGSASQLAAHTENNYDRFRLSFEGGFGPMQRVLAELETRMPQIALESLSVGPSAQTAGAGKPRMLKFDVTYLSWREGE